MKAHEGHGDTSGHHAGAQERDLGPMGAHGGAQGHMEAHRGSTWRGGLGDGVLHEHVRLHVQRCEDLAQGSLGPRRTVGQGGN